MNEIVNKLVYGKGAHSSVSPVICICSDNVE
jgi:hypothetical protein